MLKWNDKNVIVRFIEFCKLHLYKVKHGISLISGKLKIIMLSSFEFRNKELQEYILFFFWFFFQLSTRIYFQKRKKIVVVWLATFPIIFWHWLRVPAYRSTFPSLYFSCNVVGVAFLSAWGNNRHWITYLSSTGKVIKPFWHIVPLWAVVLNDASSGLWKLDQWYLIHSWQVKAFFTP